MGGLGNHPPLSVLAYIIHNPLVLGICLMAFGVLWIVVSSLLSLLFPVAPRDPNLSEHTSHPAHSLDDYVHGEPLHEGGAAGPHEDSFLPAAVQEDISISDAQRDEAEIGLQGAREERRNFLHLQMADRYDMQARAQRVKTQSSALSHLQEEVVRETKEYESDYQSLALQEQALHQRKQEFEALKERLTNSRPPVPDTAPFAAQKQQETEWLESEQSRRRKKEKNMNRRLASWRAAWSDLLNTENQRAESKLSHLQEDLRGLEARVQAQQLKKDEALKKLQQGREKLQQEERKFQTQVKEPWEREQAQIKAHIEALAQKRAALEQEVQALQGQRRQEQALFTQSMANARLEAKQKQSQWKTQVHDLQRRTENKAVQLSSQISQNKVDYEKQKRSIEETLEEQYQALSREVAELESRKAAFVSQAEGEKAHWSQTLSGVESQVSNAQNVKEAVEKALHDEMQEQAKQVSERQSWAEHRFQTMTALLQKTRQATADRFNDLRQERNALKTALEKERHLFQSQQDKMRLEYQAKHMDLAQSLHQAENEHAGHVVKAQSQEQSLRVQLAKLEQSIQTLEKKTAVFKEKSAQAFHRRRQRYDNILLKMEQKAEKEQTSADNRLAQGRMALESLTQRIAQRRVRLKKIQERRLQEFQQHFEQAQATAETVRQAYTKEAGAWADKLASLRLRRENMQKKINWLKGEPKRISQAYEDKEQQEAKKFEIEKSRFLQETQDYWQRYEEETAWRQDLIRQSFQTLQKLDADLSQQEAAARQYLEAITAQVARLCHLRDYFKNSPQKSSEQPLAKTSAA